MPDSIGLNALVHCAVRQRKESSGVHGGGEVNHHGAHGSGHLSQTGERTVVGDCAVVDYQDALA
ncbi:hypothetical protein D3C86_2071360 [compost metagenome]